MYNRENRQMMKKNYIFTLVETRNNKAFSAVLNRRRIFMLIVSTIALFCMVLYPVFHNIQKIKTNVTIQNLQKENTILRQTFTSWNQRMASIENDLSSIYEKNEHIQKLTAPSFSTMQYGVGGPSSLTELNLPSIPAANETAIELTKLETQVDWVKKNISNLETSISGRFEEISHYPSIRPTDRGWYSSFFGKRNDPFTGKIENHPGLDIALPSGSNIYATADGVVKDVRTTFVKNKGYGKYIIIEHGYGFETLYAHLSEIHVSKGQRVKRWDVIGLSGHTGKSTAPHLHYGIYADNIAQNPIYFILQ